MLQHGTKKDIKALFKIAGQLHRAGYHAKITRDRAGLVVLAEKTK